MVHISGDVPLNAGNEAYHGVDRADFLHRLFADVTKWSVRVERSEDIPGILSRAFALAVSGRPGPVHVDIPEDIVRSGPMEIQPYLSSLVKKQSPPEDQVRQARQALAAAQRPIICAGRGVLVHRAEAELVALAEAVSAPVLCSSYGTGVIPDDHPLAVGTVSMWQGNSFAMELLAESDFFLAVGLRSGTPLTNMLFEDAPENAILVALDEPHTLRPLEGVISVIASDSRLFLSRLLTHADEFQRPPDPSLPARIAQHREAFQRGLTSYMATFKNAQPLHFGRVMQELSVQSGQDAIFVSGVGNHNIWGQTMISVQDRESFIQEGPWGTMGGELAGGIAAKLVYPHRQVVVITGDGSLLMAASELVTAVETGANILVVVLNDSRYGMITALQKMRFQRPFGNEIGRIDFARWAESFGATGIHVESPDALPEAVARALTKTTEIPVILDAVCDYQYRWPDREALLALGLEQGASEK